MTTQELIQQFVTKRLDGDINNFVTYDLAQLEGDKTFGCPGRSFDCDDTNVARAVYCLVFGDVFPNLTMETLQDRTYRGDTMNSFRTLFGKYTEGYATCEDVYNIPQELADKIHRFSHTYHTIGNMLPLPNKKTTQNLNLMRSNLWGDYFDRFLMEVRDYLWEDSYHEKFTPLMEANDFAFEQYKGTEYGIGELMEGLMLHGYTKGGSMLQFLLPIKLRKKVPEVLYLKHAEHYVDFCTELIEERGKMMTESLKGIL